MQAIMSAHDAGTMLGTIVFLMATLSIGWAVFSGLAVLEGYRAREQATTHDNPAVVLRLCGFMAALIVATFGSYHPVGELADIKSASVALGISVVILVVSLYVNDKFILREVSNTKAIVQDRNVAVAIVEVATCLTTAIIFASGMHNPENGLLSNIIWFGIGQVFLVGLVHIFAYLAPSVFSKVVEGNAACALTLSGLILSGGLAVGGAIHGAFSTWYADLMKVGIALAIWAALMFATFLVVNKVVLLSNDLRSSELTVDNNWSVGILHAFMFVATTAAFVSIHAYN